MRLQCLKKKKKFTLNFYYILNSKSPGKGRVATNCLHLVFENKRSCHDSFFWTFVWALIHQTFCTTDMETASNHIKTSTTNTLYFPPLSWWNLQVEPYNFSPPNSHVRKLFLHPVVPIQGPLWQWWKWWF